MSERYDALSGAIFLVGIYEGVVPLVARIVFDGTPFLALPARLDAPAWWIVSIAVIVVAVVLLELVDRAKQRAAASST